MKNMLEYKGYYGSVNYSKDDDILYGKIEFIHDLVDFQGASLSEIKSAFHTSVDEYIETCKENNKIPDQPFKGSFNVRIGAELHRQVAISAAQYNISLNDWVTKAIKFFLCERDRSGVYNMPSSEVDMPKSYVIAPASRIKNELFGDDIQDSEDLTD